MKNFIIIGGSKGIGKAIAEILSKDLNNKVFVLSRNQNQESDVDNIVYKHLDVNSFDIDKESYPDTIDGLVYCPGTINLKPFHRLKEEDFQNDWNINFMGAVKALQSFYPALNKSPNASVVLFSTVASSLGMPFHSSIASVKSAIEGLTRSLAAEYAPKIRFNCIAPSLTDTPLADKLLSSVEKAETIALKNPMKRNGKADDIAQMAAFLLSENATWITGQVLHVDGGMSVVK